MSTIHVDAVSPSDGAVEARDLPLTIIGTKRPQELTVELRHVVLGGFTSRDRDALDRHLSELAAIGVAAPPEIPAFWPVPPSLVTTSDRILVDSEQTSGEVECGFIGWDRRCLVVLASDHTSRDVEARSIVEAKSLCPKVVSTRAIPFDLVEASWDEIVLTCEVRDDDAQWKPYQRDCLASVMRPRELVAAHHPSGRLRHGEMLLSGTIPLLDSGTRFPSCYRCRLTTPTNGIELELEYTVEVIRRQDGARPGDGRPN